MNVTQILTNIIAYAVQIGILVGIGAALPVLLRLKVPRARLLYWQLLLVACLALPWVRAWHEQVITVSHVTFTATPVVTSAEASVPVRPTIPTPGILALWFLAAGIAVRLIWLFIGLLKLARHRRHGRSMPLPPEWNNAARRTRLLVSDEISGPVTFGFFRPVVLLPASFPAMPPAMQEAILFHELLHVERSDWLFTLAEEILRAVFWMHPAIWWVLGEIQLAREQTVDQAVIEMTQARDPYVDTLLAMAGVHQQMDLAPAPLFLRRRHLKQRVMGLVQEVRMSKTRIILAQAAALTTIAAVCWVITGAIPLQAQAQTVADDAGVTVNLNGSQLMHRSSVLYPVDALRKGVEGTVVVQVRLDSNGEVLDDAILSGPDELRKGVQQSVLNWHFDKSAGSSTRVVNIDFVKPANALIPMVVKSSDAAGQANPALVRMMAGVPGGRGGSGAFRPAQAQLRLEQGQLSIQKSMAAGTIDHIDVIGLSDSAKAQLLAQLPVHAGDPYSLDALNRVTEAAREFDPHLAVQGASGMSDSHVIIIRTQQPSAFTVTTTSSPAPAGAQRVGGNVQSAKLITQVKPVYPPLAKMARQQGTVRFETTIAKDGTVENLNVVSGPPLLIPAAMEAVKKWVYQPTLLNGVPVEVLTTVDINFTLVDDGAAPPPQ